MRRGHDDGVGGAGLKRADVEALAVDRDRRHAQPGLLDDQPLRMPARVLQSDILDAVGAQPAARERQSLAKARADDQVLGIGRRAADAAEVVSQRLAQLGHAARVAVADRIQRGLAPGTAQRAQPPLPGEAGQIRKTWSEVVGELRLQRWCRRPGRLRADPAGDLDGGALPGLQIALGHKLLIGRGDHAARDAELRSQPAARRQPCAGRQAPVADRVAHGALDLLVQRLLATALELYQQVNWPFQISHNWNCTRGQISPTLPPMSEITVIGGGLAGLAAAITCAEGDARVRLFEAHQQLGGRARSIDGSYRANLGPHAVYTGGVPWDWLTRRGLMPPLARPPLTGVRFHHDGAVHRAPPLSLIPPGLRLRGRMAPIDQDFRSWATDHADERTAGFLSSLAGVYTFYHDPGELSAAFVWQRTQRLLLTPRPPARFIIGGWTNLVDRARAPRPPAGRADHRR